jgi:hypothetical protein
MKQNGKAKTELKQALKADPDLQLNEDFATPALRKLFKELGGHEPKAEVEENARRGEEEGKGRELRFRQRHLSRRRAGQDRQRAEQRLQELAQPEFSARSAALFVPRPSVWLGHQSRRQEL